MFKDKYIKYQVACYRALQEIIDYLEEEYPCLEDDDCTEIVEDHGHAIEDIKGAFASMEDAASSEAYGAGFVTDVSEKYFNWDAFMEDMKGNGNYIELSSGAIIYKTQ